MGEGRHEQLYDRLGAHPLTHEGVDGTAFVVWAPMRGGCRWLVISMPGTAAGIRCGAAAARRLGDLSAGIGRGEVYKYEILNAYGHLQPLKADPVGFCAEMPPDTASVVYGNVRHEWTDAGWIAAREADRRAEPVSIYEVHLGSWRRTLENGMLDYAALGTELIDYVSDMGFTHVEFLPVSEHPFSGSWGYQPVGMFAPTSRFGAAEDFAEMVDRLHGAGIGVIVDWVPAFRTTRTGWGSSTAPHSTSTPTRGRGSTRTGTR